MKRSLFAALVAAVFCATGVIHATAQSANDGKIRWMIFKNDSKLTAASIHIIPTSQFSPLPDSPDSRDRFWSRELLEGNAIRTGKSFPVDLDDGSRGCLFDILVTSDNPRTQWNLDRIDVCDGKRTIILKDPPVSDGRDLRVIIKNDTKSTAAVAYSLPSGLNCCWSRDLFGVSVVLPGKTFEAKVDDTSGRCTFDFHIVGSGMDWNFDGVDICKEARTLVLKPVPPRSATDDKDRKMLVKNASNIPIDFIQIIPSSKGCCWSLNLLDPSPDRLPSMIEGNKEMHLAFDNGSTECTFDVRVYGLSREWNLDSIDVCSQHRTITLR